MTVITAEQRNVPIEENEEIVSEAILLMKQSLNLLDEAGVGCTAFGCHLSMAIDTAEASKWARALQGFALFPERSELCH